MSKRWLCAVAAVAALAIAGCERLVEVNVTNSSQIDNDATANDGDNVTNEGGE